MRLFSGQNSQLAGQILFSPDVSVGHFQKLFRALYKKVASYSGIGQLLGMAHKRTPVQTIVKTAAIYRNCYKTL